MARTSMSHPLYINDLPLGNGKLGITLCPGKKSPSLYGEDWDRDLDLDMDAIKIWGADAVLTLIKKREFKELSVPGLGEAVKKRGIKWFHFPIKDGKSPTTRKAMERWRDLSPRLHRIIERGGSIVIHCKGGLGRAGTIAALLRIEGGRSTSEAIRDIRSVRGGDAIEPGQERWLTRKLSDGSSELRTSETHPLYLDDLELGNGKLGITLCPGKKGPSLLMEAELSDLDDYVWDRDLDLDMDQIRNWDADAVLTLIEEHEFTELSVLHLGAAVKARGIEWFHFPITDTDVPTPEAMERWRDLSPELHRIIERGGRIAIHCRGGLGRAGTIAALLLAERCRPAPEAISDVRAARRGTLKRGNQTQWLTHHVRQHDPRGNQLHASLIGGAVGDSLGAEIEFLSLDEIRRQYPDGITELPPHRGLHGAITDDTQMTLFTAEGIIRAHVGQALKGIWDPLSAIHHALLRWLRTQGGKPRVATDDAGLIADHRLWARRDPGLTCLSALEQSAHFGALAKNGSKGCGTIMRVAPAGLMIPRDQVRAVAMKTSALTHGHLTGQYAAAAWAEMLADVTSGAKLEESAADIASAYAQLEGAEETVRAIRNAIDAPRDGTPETVEELGGGWTAEEALSIALYACLTGKSFEDGLHIAVLHSGDSDSTGAIAGNMLGLINPAAALSHRWASVIEGADIITRLVRDYLRLERQSSEAELLADTYPGT